MKRITMKEVKKFLKDNKMFLLQMGIIAGTVALAGDVSFANESTPAGYEKLVSPLKGLQTAITGPVAKGIGVVGIGILGASTAMNFENQVSKRALQLLGGAGAGMGAADVIMAAGSGLVFL